MDRMTHERVNGLKTGYWSPEKKEELVQRLAAYENTGLEPRQVQELKRKYWSSRWRIMANGFQWRSGSQNRDCMSLYRLNAQGFIRLSHICQRWAGG